jgi:hypothetical protein
MFDISSQPFLFNTNELDQDNSNYSKPYAVVERSVVGGFISGMNQERFRNKMNKKSVPTSGRYLRPSLPMLSSRRSLKKSATISSKF